MITVVNLRFIKRMERSKRLPKARSLMVSYITSSKLLTQSQNRSATSKGDICIASYPSALLSVNQLHVRDLRTSNGLSVCSTKSITDKILAFKCNPYRMLLRLLADTDVNFDCASLAEIEQVFEVGLDARCIIFAHPESGSGGLTALDSGDELDKTQRICPDIELLLSICVPDLEFTWPLLDLVYWDLRLSKNPDVEGRHNQLTNSGSGSSDTNAFVPAVHYARCVFEESKELGFAIHMLDFSGSFEEESFGTMACTLCEAIARKFPIPIIVIAEPGRFYARGFYTMICEVIARRAPTGTSELKTPDMLYMNDVIYGCFSPCCAENVIFVQQLTELQGEHGLIPRRLEPHRYSTWGPTCCGIHFISKNLLIDREVVIGDWLKFRNMGGKRSYQSLDVWRLASLGEAIELMLTGPARITSVYNPDFKSVLWVFT
ncbi:ornithine decarboxylase protein [Rutstroemia sp. NJR-2017a BVV2]|nr:ornithine decarboxylase protein [Rutstroemia sp. NJR-2017a BVV2]